MKYTLMAHRERLTMMLELLSRRATPTPNRLRRFTKVASQVGCQRAFMRTPRCFSDWF
jgi:hypothetical protein